ncbi:MAG: YceI family protein [Chloroflexi bacterium]|nr:YceI family protein [Chloroflexota bacterium]
MFGRPRLVLAAVVAVIVVAVVGAGGWYFFLRDEAPPPVSLEGAVASTQETPTATAAPSAPEATPTPTATAMAAYATASPTATATTPPTATPTSTPEPTSEAAPARPDGDLAGVWTLSERGESFAGFRVREELVGIGAFTAVGRTSAVTASLGFDGSAITAVSVEVDMTQLTTDDSRRDRALRGQAIETNRFPTSTFVLAEPIAIEAVPAEGESIAATAVGDLTLHGVTRRVEIPLEGQLTDGLVVVVGSLEIEFDDYDIEAPTAPIVVSVEDRGVMEFQLVFE